jgi:predicted amino acid dehydrogenase
MFCAYRRMRVILRGAARLTVPAMRKLRLSNRWGNDADVRYLQEAQRILGCSMSEGGIIRPSQRKRPACLPDRGVRWRV